MDRPVWIHLAEECCGVVVRRRRRPSGRGDCDPRRARRAMQLPADVGVWHAGLSQRVGIGRDSQSEYGCCRRGALRRAYRRRRCNLFALRGWSVGCGRPGDSSGDEDRKRGEYEDRDRRHSVRRRVAVLLPADAHRSRYLLRRPGGRHHVGSYLGTSRKRRFPQHEPYDRRRGSL